MTAMLFYHRHNVECFSEHESVAVAATVAMDHGDHGLIYPVRIDDENGVTVWESQLGSLLNFSKLEALAGISSIDDPEPD